MGSANLLYSFTEHLLIPSIPVEVETCSSEKEGEKPPDLLESREIGNRFPGLPTHSKQIRDARC
jgi:hypothetical protein